MQQFANPARFLKLAQVVLTPIWALTAVAFGLGLYLALVTAPPDYQQGETVRIMFVHVPAAWWALGVYSAMAAASAMAAIFRHPLADVAAKAAAPIGATFCLLALVTGSLWGKPMWGAWWVWDARLTSMFVLFLLYLGYMAIWEAIEDPHRAALVARIVVIAGFINVPIVKFSVDWWNSLHQGASVFRMGGPTIDQRMLWPLLVMALAYFLLFLGLLLVAMRSEITSRKIRQMQFARLEGR
ncbi:MAG: heme ABC transporter permease [Parvibaculaceae bacterium]